MISLTRHIAATALACIALLGAGCASMDGGGAWTTSDDLQEEIQLRLDDDAMMDRSSVRVTINQGIVTLHGSVPSEHARARAVAIAEGTEGVTDVIDALHRR